MHLHSGGHSQREDTILKWSAIATLAYVVLAAAIGVWAHSLALVSEAGHNLADFLALLLSWFAVYLQRKPASPSKTYGYQRAGVLAALINVLALLALTLVIIYEAIERLRHPVAVVPMMMLIVAIVGVVMNSSIALMLEHGRSDVNIRAAFLHMVGDAVSTGLVIVGAIVISFTGRVSIDPILSLVIAGFIIWSSWDVLRETLDILLEASPRGIRSDDVSRDLMSLGGVEDVHDLHIWSLGSRAHALSCHIRIADIPPSESGPILQRVQAMLADRYHIHHTTIQFENCACAISEGCVMAAPHASLPQGH